MKIKHDVHFLHECKTQDVYPKLVRWKNIKNKTPRERINYSTKNWNSAINKRRSEVKTLANDHEAKLQALKDSTTWMNGNLIIYSIKR